MTKIKYPEIEVELTDFGGNAVGIIMGVARAMQRARVPADEIQAFKDEARSGDYDHVLQTCMRWVNC